MDTFSSISIVQANPPGTLGSAAILLGLGLGKNPEY